MKIFICNETTPWIYIYTTQQHAVWLEREICKVLRSDMKVPSGQVWISGGTTTEEGRGDVGGSCNVESIYKSYTTLFFRLCWYGVFYRIQSHQLKMQRLNFNFLLFQPVTHRSVLVRTKREPWSIELVSDWILINKYAGNLVMIRMYSNIN